MSRLGYRSWVVLLGGIAVGAGGWILLAALLDQWPVSPERDLRVYFFVALWLAISGTILPLIWVLHRRFGRLGAGESWHSCWVLARQASWIGIWVVGCAWLQMHDVLNWAMALLVLVVLILLEALLYTRWEAGQEL
jgi:hypothetical protein